MAMSKKGKITTATATTIVLTIMVIVILFQVYAEVVPEAQDAGNLMNDSQICTAAGCTFNASGSPSTCQVNTTNTSECASSYSYVPLGGLVAGSGLVFAVIMAGLLIAIIMGVLKKK